MEAVSKEKDSKKKRLIVIIIAAFLVCGIITGLLIFQSKYTALSIRLQRLVGVVNLYDKNGSERSLVEKMKLNSGNKITTATESLVTVSLDNTKLLTMEEMSAAEVKKRGKKLKFELTEGNLFFNVTEKLDKKESFEIKTSTMAVGIRGTSAYVGMDFSHHETVMVTDGTVHVVAENPRTHEKIEVDVPAGMKIVIFLDDEAEGDATISFTMEPFKEEDLPAMALDTIHKNKKLRERVLKATGFREDKLERLYELNTTEGESMVGEAKEELSKLGLDDAIPFMGDKVRYMVEAANDAVVIAEEDLDLEVAIIKGLEDTSDVAVEGGLEKEEVVSVIHTTSGVIGNLIVQAKENDLDDEAIIMVADNVSGAVTVAVKDMIVGDLSVDEIEGVVDTIGTVFGIAIDNGANEGPKAIIENVEDAYKFVKDTVNNEMNKNSNGEETSEALLRRDTGDNAVAKDSKENTSDDKNNSSDKAASTSSKDGGANRANDDSLNNDHVSSNNEGSKDSDNTVATSGSNSSTDSETTSRHTTESGNTNESPISQAVNTVKKFIIKWFASDENYAKNEIISSEEIEENVSPSAPSNPVKAASEYFTYVFRKWKAFFKGDDGSYTEAGEYASGEILSATKDANYVAQYDQMNRVYGVTLVKDGGVINGTDISSYTYGTAVNLPNNVSKAEDTMYTYRFKGWSTSSTSFSQIRTISASETGDKTYYAFYDRTAKSYDVNISGINNISGGSVSVKNSQNEELTGGVTTSTADYGTIVTVKATPNTNYSVATFTVEVTGTSSGSIITVEGTGDTRTFTMPAEAVDVSVTVTFGKAVSGVTLDITSKAINKGSSFVLTATIDPSDAANKNVTWSSDDESKVKVTAGTGLTATVECIDVGSAVITVTTEDGDFSAVCNISVTDPTIPTIDRSKWISAAQGGWGWLISSNDMQFKRSTTLPSGTLTEVQSDSDTTKIYMWSVGSVELWYSDAEYVYLPEDSSMFFYTGNNNIASKLKKVDLTGFDFAKVTTCAGMFYRCNKLESVNIGGTAAPNLQIAASMFYGCSLLRDLNMTGFTTASVNNFYGMFSGCNSLQNLDLSWLDTSSATTFESMFNECTSLSKIDVSHLNTGNVSNFGGMFSYCRSLTKLDLSGFDTSSATTMSSMFSYTSSLVKLDISSFDTSLVTSMSYMFQGCSSLPYVDLSSFTVTGTTNVNNMFFDCTSLVTIYSNSSWYTSTNGAASLFVNCPLLVGGAGTSFASNTSNDKDTFRYAVLDGQGAPGYFTAISSKEVIISNTIDHGSVTADVTPSVYAPNALVTISVSPEDGYQLQNLSVATVSGVAIDAISYSGNSYFFKMPYENVNVSATFTSQVVEINSSNSALSNEWFGTGNMGIFITMVRITESVSVDSNFTVPSDKTLMIDPNVELTIPAGITVTVNGTICNYGTLTNNGTIVNDSNIFNYSPHTLNNHGIIVNNGTIVNGDGGDNDGRLNNFDGAEIINNGVILNNEGSVINNEGDIDGNDIIGDGEINDDSIENIVSDVSGNDMPASNASGTSAEDEKTIPDTIIPESTISDSDVPKDSTAGPDE